MNGFTKLHANIVTSSLWTNEDNETRLVWVAMLALADARGCVVASIPGLAHVARIPIAKTEAAIANRADRPLQTDAPRGADYSKGF